MTPEELEERIAQYLCREAHPRDSCHGSCIHGMRTDTGDAEYPCRFTFQVSTVLTAIEEAANADPDPDWDEAGDRRRGQANVGRFVKDFIKAGMNGVERE